MDPVFQAIKKQNGEAFAQALSRHHNGLLGIPNIAHVLRHAGRDAEPLLPYLMTLLAANDNDEPAPAPVAETDPLKLLEQAGYEAFYADTLEAQNSIKHYFVKDELLCTFNDAARHENYYIIHAIKKGAGELSREAFKGQEKREDAYGTSVISIQIRKTGGFISIKNRYNHSVSSCDHTFNSNPDNIIPGLSQALKDRFDVEFTASKSPLPEGYVIMGDQIMRYHEEDNNIYYGDQCWAQGGEVHMPDKAAGDAMFGPYLFNNQTKTLSNIDPASQDSFPDDFNRDYDGKKGLSMRKGNLILGDHTLIGTERSQIKTLDLPDLTRMGDCCLNEVSSLTSFRADSLTNMRDYCLSGAGSLTTFHADSLTSMGRYCLENANSLTSFRADSLTSMGESCLENADSLTTFHADSLTSMGSYCLENADSLTSFRADSLTSMGPLCLETAKDLQRKARTIIAQNLTRQAQSEHGQVPAPS